MNKSETQVFTMGEIIGHIILSAVYAWWATWILPHFDKNTGFWPLFGVFAFAVFIIVPKKYLWLITCFLAIPTVGIWLDFVG